MSLDIYQRTCIKKGTLAAPKEEEEIEIIDVESSEASLEEEEEQLIEEEPVDVKALYDELECMKRRIQKLQLILKAKAVKECQKKKACAKNVPTCSENIEICALQKANHKLQCKIIEMVECLKFAKTNIEELRASLCAKTKEIHELQKNIAQLQFWRKNLHHEFGVCVERFEYIKHVKVEWKELKTLMERWKKESIFKQMQKEFVSRKEFFMLKGAFKTQIKYMLDTLTIMHQEQNMRYNIVAVSIMGGQSAHSAEEL